MKIGIGAVQFGMDYGISNREGRTPEVEVRNILGAAAGMGVRLIDTAAGYGASEEVLGRALPPGHAFRVVTKTPGFSGKRIGEHDAEQLEMVFHRSLARLGQPAVYGLLVHHAEDLLAEGGERLMGRMEALKARGLVEKIGVSVYTGEQVDALLARYGLDIVQLPLSVLDQRLLRNGQLARLKAAGTEIHVRSVFLQGLLLMAPDELPAYFAPIRDHLAAYRACLEREGCEPLKAALDFVLQLDEVDAVICGVNNRRQLEEICRCEAEVPKILDFRVFALDDPKFLNPANWKIQ
jgi:aryl-alcohol dehydrogenase-like predicted oxidoreductase